MLEAVSFRSGLSSVREQRYYLGEALENQNVNRDQAEKIDEPKKIAHSSERNLAKKAKDR